MREKFEKESVLTNKEDSGDRDEVFSYVDCNIDFKENENIRLLWECQRQSIKCKDSRQLDGIEGKLITLKDN